MALQYSALSRFKNGSEITVYHMLDQTKTCDPLSIHGSYASDYVRVWVNAGTH